MSINERKCDSIQETSVSFLTAAQQLAFTTLRSSLHAVSSPSSVATNHDSLTDYTLYRFLKAASFDPAAAHKNLLAYLAWREERGLAHVLNSPPAKIDVINAIVPYSYHGYDRDGRPIYIEKTGMIACSALTSEAVLSQQDFLNSHIWGIENLMTRAHQSSLKRGSRVENFTSVLDMNGLGFHHRSALGLLKACLDLDGQYYPEFVGKLYVLNVPWIAPYLYQAATPFVPEDVRQRVHVLNEVAPLLELVAPDQLPPEYGGSCTECVSVKGLKQCVLVQDSAQYTALAASGAPAAEVDDGYTRQHVATDFIQTLTCDAQGGTFTWYFECLDEMDIDFSVEIVDAKGKRFAKIPSRCTTNRGSYTAAGECSVVFKWDNSFSWMNSKNIKYATGVVKIDVAGISNSAS